MYLVSLYFDEKTNKRIQGYIDSVAKATGNVFMTDGNVPPHITISAFETKCERSAVEALQKSILKIKSDTIQWVSVGMFFPYVMYITPVINEYLYKMSCDIYENINSIDDIKIRNNYRPLSWFPHVTIGKKLSKEEMMKAFFVMQNQFGVFEGTVTKIGLAKTNPYKDIVVLEI